ncbi:M15 family metallopeptidase [Falsiporphyromonas endometrii]|uniref:D-alanyl-D-alanine dipeptidase n=2 Tax=Falsiporphyromonas endometrii TaxID=1387297 RepID=A0ABV9K7T0_9PORP
MVRAGMVNLQEVCPDIKVDLKYATSDNFVGCDMYGDLKHAFLEKGFANRVVRAQRYLQSLHPGYSLLIYDAARPISVQRKMYSLVAGTPNKVYVANGNRGGRHNYGVAVDLTIVDDKGEPLDMGTKFDFFGKEAHCDNEAALTQQGLLSVEAHKNRELLRTVMKYVGLVPYRREWWHFEETLKMPQVRSKYSLLNF